MNLIHDLIFHGPYDICSEDKDILNDCPFASFPGIYLWVVKMISGSYRVSYLGETGISFYQRTKDHLIQTLGGNYQICDPEEMRLGRHDVVWNGLWRKGTRDKFHEFLSIYESISYKIKKLILNQKLFVAPIKIERRLRQRIEGALAFAIRENAEASSLLPKDIRYYQRAVSEDPILFSIFAKHNIEGLPREISA